MFTKVLSFKTGNNAGSPATFKGMTEADTIKLADKIAEHVNTFELNDNKSQETSRQLTAKVLGEDGKEYTIWVGMNRSLTAGAGAIAKYATQSAKGGKTPEQIAADLEAQIAAYKKANGIA